MKGQLVIQGGQVVRPQDVVIADLTIEDGVVRDISEGAAQRQEQTGKAGTRLIDAEGAYILPGLVDLHCDAIEKEVEPRPNTLFPMDMAFIQYERKLASHGITTMLHSLSLGVGLSLRGEHLVSALIHLIHSSRQESAMIRHGVHLRYEISHLAGLPLAEQLIEDGLIDYLSFMDHAPGIGQYKRPGAFERYVMKNQGVDAEECKRIIDELQERRKAVDGQKLLNLGRKANERGIAIASHDDDSHEQVDRSLALGARVSEFPLSLATAMYATGRGLEVCVGAPNLVRGGSHDKNLTALDAVRAKGASIICSDYHPASLLHSLFVLEREGIPLSDAVRMASLTPAQVIGKEAEIGSLETGKQADALIVRIIRGVPVVTHTIVGGTVVMETANYYKA